MPDKIYVIGHQSPDLDSAAAAISYANFKNNTVGTDKYVPAVAGELNRATKFVLDKFGFAAPEKMENAAGRELILVDHNEALQRVRGEARIVEVLDHHKMVFEYPDPIDITVRAWGSSNSIIYHLYKHNNIEIGEKLAGLMLSAILDDTVITRSPTCTDFDKKFITELSKLAKVDDYEALGVEIFKAKSDLKNASAEEVLKSDYKDFELPAGKFLLGQVETADLKELTDREDELMEAAKKTKEAGNYHTVFLFLTDILNQGSKILTVSDEPERVEKAMEIKLENGRAYKEGLMSRKKQVVPVFTEEFGE